MLTGAGLDRVWHHSRAHRLFTNARWSGDTLGSTLADLIVARLLPSWSRAHDRGRRHAVQAVREESLRGWRGITTARRRARNPSGSATAGSWPHHRAAVVSVPPGVPAGAGPVVAAP